MAEIVNWYDKIGAGKKKTKLPLKWKNHHIHHNSMILCIGGTGTGKTNALIDYLSRSSGEFFKIIIISFSTLDEPLYNYLQKNDQIEFINDINEVPELSEFDDEEKNKPKLIVFDDFIRHWTHFCRRFCTLCLYRPSLCRVLRKINFLSYEPLCAATRQFCSGKFPCMVNLLVYN